MFQVLGSAGRRKRPDSADGRLGFPAGVGWRSLPAILAMVLVRPAVAMEIRGEAFVGRPFGVGVIQLRLAASELPPVLGIDGLGVSERQGRALYPAVDRTLLQGVLDDPLVRPARVRIFFLFPGRGPLELSIQARRSQDIAINPKEDARAYRRALRAWWRGFSGEGKLLPRRPDWPPVVENYLQALLARRIGLPLETNPVDTSYAALFRADLAMGAGLEEIRLARQRARMLGPPTPAGPADQPLPEPVAVRGAEPAEPPEDVPVEPIAERVPAECLYIRFGSFANFLWFQDTLAQWAGDLQGLLSCRGFHLGLARKIEEQLVLCTSTLARLLGDAAVADVAFIGTDLCFSEGAGYGLLLQAQPANPMLGADIRRQRLQRIEAGDGVTERKRTLAGREVSFVTSPDGRVRSFYVADRPYHLVTTSETLARRFLETASGSESLADSRDFRHARTVTPLDRQDTVFIYASPAFFRHWMSPAYRVERARRIEAQVELELVELARRAARAEGKAAGSIDALRQAGFLPADFGTRPDGSRAVLENDTVSDSLRGHRGAFLPVVDLPVRRATADEAAAYQQFAQEARTKWKEVDPLLVAVRRQPQASGQDRITLDARFAPLSPGRYAVFRRFLGEPQSQRLAPVRGDLASLEVAFPGTRRFVGLRDAAPRSPLAGVIPGARLLQLLDGYVGTTGEMGLPEPIGRWLAASTPLGPADGPAAGDQQVEGLADPTGSAGRQGGLWRRKIGPFLVFSFYRDVLEDVTPQLRYVDAARPAQLWLRVGEVSNSRLTPLLNQLGYRRCRKACLGDLKLLHTLGQQLRLPAPSWKAEAERLLGEPLACPLGGEYVFAPTGPNAGIWQSTALPDTGRRRHPMPADYQAPVVRWLRGLDAELRLGPHSLALHAELLIQTAGPPAR